MMGKRAFIYAAGKYTPEDIKLYKRIKLKDDDIVICADGGYDALYYTSIVPDVIIGDFDSMKSPVPKDVEIIRYSSDKDKTDLEICIDYACDKGCDTVFIMGALGGRIDHTMGALYALKYALEIGVKAMILNASSRVYITDSELEIRRENFKYVSLIPCTDKVSGLTAKGLKYGLSDAELKQGSSFGISNEFYNNTAEIKIKRGILFVICTEQ